MTAEFLFVRHAESVTNAQPHVPSAQVPDPILSEFGQQQAEAFASSISSRKILAIYTSDTNRARATAQPLETRHGILRKELNQLDEWNLGKGGKVAKQSFAAMLERWRFGEGETNLDGAPNSETLLDLVSRVVPALQSIFECHRSSSGTIVVVSHGGALSWTTPFFVKNVEMSFAIDHYLGNCDSITIRARNQKPYVSNWAGHDVD